MPFDKTEYERDFSAAMQTKLLLNCEARVKVAENSPSDKVSFNHKAADEFRNEIAEAGMRCHPNPTKETALQMLREFGL